VAIWAGLAILSAAVIVPLFDMRFDFTPRYLGGRALWSGISPYSEEITLDIQHAIMGENLPPNAGRHQMFYPAYVGITLAPLLPLPFPTAAAIWLGLQLTCVLVAPLLWALLLGWKIRPIMLAVLVIGFGLIFRYPINMYVVGQFIGTILLGMTAAYALLQAKRDVWAGVVLAITAMPPQVGIAAAGILLGGYALRGRWRGLIAFAAVIGALMLVTFVQVGWWIPDFLRQLREYTIYGDQTSALLILGKDTIRAGMIALVGAVTLLLLNQYRRGRIDSLDLFALAILAPLLGLVPTGNYYLVLLIPLMVIALWRVHGKRGGWIIWLGVALAVISPWVYREIAPELEMLTVPLHVGLVYVGAVWIEKTDPTPNPSPNSERGDYDESAFTLP